MIQDSIKVFPILIFRMSEYDLLLKLDDDLEIRWKNLNSYFCQFILNFAICDSVSQAPINIF